MSHCLSRKLFVLLCVFVVAVSSSRSPQSCSSGELLVEGKCKICPVAKWCDGSECRAGHQGYLCSQCAGNYFYQKKNESCKSCPKRHAAVMAYVLTALGMIFLAVIMYWTESGHDVTTFSICATHFQLVYVFFQIPFSYPAFIQMSTGPLGFVSGFFFDILTDWAEPECTNTAGSRVDTYAFWWIVSSVGPLFLIFPFVLRAQHFSARIDGVAKFIRARGKETGQKLLSLDEYTTLAHSTFWQRHAIQNALIVSTLLFMHGVGMSIGIWYCRRFPDGTLRLDQYPSVECSLTDREYRVLLASSLGIFALYFFGYGGFLVAIVESSEGRQAAATHHVTHARLLVNATRREQILFFFQMLVHGETFGKKQERLRIWRRLKTYLRITAGFLRNASSSGGTHNITPEEMRLTQNAIERFRKAKRVCSLAPCAPGNGTFPVLVQQEDTKEWVKGIFQRAEKDKLIVATTTGEHVSCSSYASAKIIFEQDRQIKITNDLHSWIEQDGDDPAAAHAGAPLGFTGIVESVRKMNEKGGRGNASAASEEREDNPESDPECGLQHRQVKKIPSVEQHPDYCKDADLAFLPTTDFTFLLDLTDTIGIDVAQRRHRGVVVTRVEEGTQALLAAVKPRCVVRRVGSESIKSPEDFELAIIKRRIVSAKVRQEILEKHPEARVTPLGPEDVALLANDEVKRLIKPREHDALNDELRRQSSGTVCTVTFQDHNFDIVRRLSSDYHSFHQIAQFVSLEPFWDTYSMILSRYKGSMRNYELVSMLRKTTAVLISVFLSRTTELQAFAMLSMVLFSFAMHLQLQPYDDQNPKNIFNMADHAISNNTLEKWLLILQILQLGYGLVNNELQLPGMVSSLVYFFIIGAAVALVMTALSSEMSKSVHIAHRNLEPCLRSLGFGSRKTKEDRSRSELAKKKQLQRQALLGLARTYEQSKMRSHRAVALEAIAADTATTAARKRDVEARKAAFAAKREGREEGGIVAARDAYEVRQRQAKEGHLVTAVDKLGHFSKSTDAQHRSFEARKEEEAKRKMGSGQAMSLRQRREWETRRKKSLKKEGSAKLFTVPDDGLSRLTESTTASHHRDAARLDELAAGANSVRDSISKEALKAKESWERRRRRQLQHSPDQTKFYTDTTASEADFTATTTTMQYHTRAWEEQQRKKSAEVSRHEEERRRWEARLSSESSTKPDDIGHLGDSTANDRHRRSSWEAHEKAQREMRKEQEEKREQERTRWQRRYLKSRNGSGSLVSPRSSRRFVEMDANSKSEDESDGSGGDEDEDDDDDEGDGGFSRI